MLLVDTSQYSVKDRGELIRDEFSDPASGYFAPADGDDLLKMRFRTWDMGDGCSLLNLQSSGLLIGMRPPRLSSAESPVIGNLSRHRVHTHRSAPCRCVPRLARLGRSGAARAPRRDEPRKIRARCM